jgi:hypothetical protein
VIGLIAALRFRQAARGNLRPRIDETDRILQEIQGRLNLKVVPPFVR